MSPEIGKREPPKAKDGWDKADIFAKVFTGVVLGLVGFVINNAATRVTQATQRGQLTANLVDMLVKQDSIAKRDMVLASLDSLLLDNDQSSLVCTLSVQVVRGDFTKTSVPEPSLPPASEVAIAIVKKRCPDRVSELVNASSQKRVVSKPDAEKPAQLTETFDFKAAPFQTYVLPNIVKNIVYVQYRSDWASTDKLPLLHDELQKAGYESPRKDEKIDASVKFRANVRYFHPSDKNAATSIQNIVQQVTGTTYKLVDLSQSKFSPPAGQIEVWCSPES